MKPLIIITPDDFNDPMSHRPFYLTKRSYASAVAGAGGSPYLALEARFYEDYAEMADGLLLAGSMYNVNPARYNESVRVPEGKTVFDAQAALSFTKDSLDLTLCKAFLAKGKPIFGIGRGMEVLNVALGGSLYQDLEGDLKLKHPQGADYKVKTAEGSKLAELLGPEITVKNYNTQAIKELGEGLEAAACTENGIIEAVWHKELPVFGVMWHPETYKTSDDADWAENKDLIDPIEPDMELNARLMEFFKTKSPMTGFATDKDVERPTDNALFNYFIALCRKEA
jgi:putative glutamine amidotransferase